MFSLQIQLMKIPSKLWKNFQDKIISAVPVGMAGISFLGSDTFGALKETIILSRFSSAPKVSLSVPFFEHHTLTSSIADWRKAPSSLSGLTSQLYFS